MVMNENKKASSKLAFFMSCCRDAYWSLNTTGKV